MTDRELFEKALKGLEAAYEGQIWLSHLPDLITALRERLEQPEQEQEPVVWLSWNDKDGYGYWDTKAEADLNCAGDTEPEPLYTAPPQPAQRQWVGSADLEDSNAYLIGDVNKMVLVEDLAAELFVVAQQSPADDGFSDTINRIEAWLRKHFTIPLQPEQEPVAWPCHIIEADFSERTITLGMESGDYKVSAGTHYLSITPPQRTWVGLTDEEVKALPQWFPSHETAAVLPLIFAVEAKLREKNA